MDRQRPSSRSAIIPPRKSKARRWFLWILFAFLAAGIGTIGWLAYNANAALSKISDVSGQSQGGLLPLLTNQQNTLLQGEANDRVNILLLGIGGAGHDGPYLTDTMELLSIEPKEKRAALLSVPRDLYVTIPGYGSGKINSADAIGEERQPGQGPALAKETVSQILGLPIQYYVRLDFQGFVSLVNVLGGLDINVEKPINDPFYPDDKTNGYDPFYLKAGPTHMDGALALKYARSRETTSDFDRSHRQQQLLAAIKDKVLSVNTLVNPKKINDLITIVGDHVRTDLSVPEMERLATILKDVPTSSITTTVLDTSTNGPLVGLTDSRGYIILPRKGNFSEVQAIAANLFNDHQEIPPPTITIENASGQADVGGNVALILRGHGYQVSDVTSATTIRSTNELLEKNPAQYTDLTQLLEQQFAVRPQKATSDQMQTDVLLIIGSNYLQTTH